MGRAAVAVRATFGGSGVWWAWLALAEALAGGGWLFRTAPLAPAGANDFAAKPAEAANFAAGG